MSADPEQNRHEQNDSDVVQNRRILWIETGIVLFLTAAPTLGWMACWLFWNDEFLHVQEKIQHLGSGTSTEFAIDCLEYIFYSLRLAPVVLFIMWRSGDKWAKFGLVHPKLGKDILIGLGMTLIVGAIGQMSFSHWKWARLYPSPVPPDWTILLLANSLTVGFSEELILHGYLIPRLETLIGSTWKSIVLSAIIYSLLHISKSFWGIVTTCLSGAIWGIGFCATRRIWPSVISHSLLDFVVSTRFASVLLR
jgi:membrane protease YdiL (CAAX protease family)